MGYAYLFPGQASQIVGMAQDLYEKYASVRDRFAEAEDVLGFSLAEICFDGPIEKLSQTSVTQPAVFVHSVAVAEILASQGLAPACTAGHSLGEYSALAAAGAVSFRQGLELVGERGRLMQETGDRHPGKMAAVIGLDNDAVERLCVSVAADDAVAVANFNAPGQVVVSGEAAAVDAFVAAAPKAGARRVVPLPVSGAFHSCLMQPAADAMTPLLQEADIKSPRVPVVTNVQAEPVTDGEELREQLISQITHPVRWTESVRAIAGFPGTDTAVEVGPGAVLKGLARRIDRDLTVLAAGTDEDIESVVSTLREPVGSE